MAPGAKTTCIIIKQFSYKRILRNAVREKNGVMLEKFSSGGPSLNEIKNLQLLLEMIPRPLSAYSYVHIYDPSACWARIS